MSREDRVKLVESLIFRIRQRCYNQPVIFEEAKPLLDLGSWREAEFFKTEANKTTTTSVFDDEISALVTNPSITSQLEHQDVDVGGIISDWQNLKKAMNKWGKVTKPFPPQSWQQIGERIDVANFSNLFSLVDFLLCHSLSSADAERGFSALKQVKTARRSVLGNDLLSIQLRAKIDGPSIAEFDPARYIEYWLLNPTSRSKSGESRAKRLSHMETEHLKAGPKPKQKKPIPIFDISGDNDEEM